jgi:ABC-2 type transport system permease protein
MYRVIFANLLGNDAERIARASRPMDVQERTIALQPEVDPGQALSFGVAYVTTLLFTVVTLASASLLLNSVSMEKGSRVMEILLLSVTPRQLLAGKIVGLGIAGLLQMVAWVGTGFALLRVFGSTLSLPPGFVLPSSILAWALVFFLLGYAIYASLMAGLGALVPNLKEASQATILVIWPLVLSLAVFVINSETPHAPVIVGLSLFPLSAPVVMMARLVAGGVPWWQPFLAAGLMLFAAVLILRAVAGMFRAQVLLSGQPFTARRLFAALAGRA